MTLSDFVSDLARKFRPTPPYVPQPTYRPPVVVRPPVPISATPAIPPAEQQPAASLVSSVDHPRGRGHAGGSLINGR